MELFYRLERELNALVWGPATAAALLGTGLFLSLRCGFPQIRRFGYILRHTALAALRGRREGDGENLSPFQAMTTALAGTVGTGNIAGVAGAILAGGPGAVFWMWVSALFGMCTKFAEIALALRWREASEGKYRGGPMYYITGGLGPRFRPLAALFALAGSAAGFGVGNLVQSSEIAGAARELLGLPPAARRLNAPRNIASSAPGICRKRGRIAASAVRI